MDDPIIFYAPNVHTGGGFVLLKSLISSWPSNKELHVILDLRCKHNLSSLINSNIQVKFWVAPSSISRLKAEIILFLLSRNNEKIICFHNLPPILSQSKNVTVFLQNRLLLCSFLKIPFFSKLFLVNMFERIVFNTLKHKPREFIVQTESMKNLLSYHFDHLESKNIKVKGFFENPSSQNRVNINDKKYDFIYASSSEKYKNHLTLLESWILLSDCGIKKTLVLTVDGDESILSKIDFINGKYGKLIFNFGSVPHSELLDLYSQSKALIFPSLEESYGLPLLEANALNLPILAPELDYVRDVCEPSETFDPISAISISRAIKRFHNLSEPPTKPLSPTQFWASAHGSDHEPFIKN